MLHKLVLLLLDVWWTHLIPHLADQLLLQLGLEISNSVLNRRFGGSYYTRYITLAPDRQLSFKLRKSRLAQIENSL